MPITLYIPPAVAREVGEYAEAMGTTLSGMVYEYLVNTARELKKEKETSPFCKYCGILEEGEAERIRREIAPLRTIDEEMWK